MATPPPEQPLDRGCRDTEDCRITDVELLLNHAATELTRRFEGTFEYHAVRRCLRESYDLLAARARIHTHLPVLAVRSAGSAPAQSINPAVVEVMRERGIDIAQQFPQSLTDDNVQAADVVITMGCGDACPVYPGKRYLNWELDDPAGKSVDDIRPIRDDIDRRVQDLLTELVPADAGPAAAGSR